MSALLIMSKGPQIDEKNQTDILLLFLASYIFGKSREVFKYFFPFFVVSVFVIVYLFFILVDEILVSEFSHESKDIYDVSSWQRSSSKV